MIDLREESKTLLEELTRANRLHVNACAAVPCECSAISTYRDDYTSNCSRD